MIDTSETSIQSISIHHVAVNVDDSGVEYSTNPVNVDTDHLHENLLQYFLSSFKTPEFFNFKMPDDNLELNPIGNLASEIFLDPLSIHEHSKRIADHLYLKSMHPKIKSGDLLVCYFDDVLIEDEMVSAIGIFKNEEKESFLKLLRSGPDYHIQVDQGIAVNRLQKGCLILNTEKEEGYKVCMIDKIAKEGDAAYWKTEFMSLRNRVDNYHITRDTIQATKSFIEEKLKLEAEVDKADEAQILNKAQEYFKSLDRFNETEYENSLFEDDNRRLEFQNYKREYEQQRSVELPDQFDISQPAVRSQSRVFKSVIKLDRNFHIYVHGDRSKITRGIDETGRKFYKIYYDVEA